MNKAIERLKKIEQEADSYADDIVTCPDCQNFRQKKIDGDGCGYHKLSVLALESEKQGIILGIESIFEEIDRILLQIQFDAEASDEALDVLDEVKTIIKQEIAELKGQLKIGDFS